MSREKCLRATWSFPPQLYRRRDSENRSSLSACYSRLSWHRNGGVIDHLFLYLDQDTHDSHIELFPKMAVTSLGDRSVGIQGCMGRKWRMAILHLPLTIYVYIEIQFLFIILIRNWYTSKRLLSFQKRAIEVLSYQIWLFNSLFKRKALKAFIELFYFLLF